MKSNGSGRRLKTDDERQFDRAVGQRLREFRQVQGLTVAELARLCNTSQHSVMNWEHGQRAMPLRALARLLQATGMPAEWLLPPVDPT